MKIAFLTAESLPFLKTGGLADVSYGLTKSLVKQGHEVKVFMPKYQKIINQYGDKLEHITDFTVYMNGFGVYCGIDHINNEGVDFYFIDNEYFYNRDSSYGLYSNDDETLRFSFFNRAVLDSFTHLDFYCDVLHLNDWHTAIAGHILNTEHRFNEKYKDIKVYLTIHNLKFQGWHSLNTFDELAIKYNENLIMDNSVNFLKSGIMNAHKINTVSPTYRNATLTQIAGCGLDSVLKLRENDYWGILNGIDTTFFNPSTSEYIYENYSKENYKEKKKINKLKFKQDFKLSLYEDRPLYSVISRLDPQKGLDLLINILPEVLENEHLDFFVLGSGEKYIEDSLRFYSAVFPNFNAYIGYSEEIAHKLYAASDFFVMPSKFEPCGLSQMISLAFGTIPIVNDVDGLHDSIICYDDFSKEGYGIKISNLTEHELYSQIKRAQYLYYNFDHMTNLITNAMNVDFSFDHQVNEYLKMYKE